MFRGCHPGMCSTIPDRPQVDQLRPLIVHRKTAARILDGQERYVGKVVVDPPFFGKKASKG